MKVWVSSDVLSDSAIFDLLEKKTGIEAFSKLKELNPPALQAYNESLEKLLYLIDFDDFKQTVEMPGIITETNSVELKGGQVNWEVNADNFFIKNYVMHVESRVVNYWTFIFTGIIILLSVFVLIVKGFKK